MTKHHQNGIDLSILNMPTKKEKELFCEMIVNDAEKQVGSWNAYLCKTMDELLKRLHTMERDSISIMIDRIPHDQIWPLAYLHEIEINEDVQRRGYGSAGLQRFARQARRRLARTALTKIGWCDPNLDDGGMKKNRNFYQKNGWRELFCNDANGLPIGLPLAFLSII